MAFVPTEEFGKQVLVNAMAGTPSPGLAGILTGAKLKPYVAAISPTMQTLLADLTFNIDATLAGVALTWGAAYRRTEGGIAVDSALVQYALTDPLNACIVYGLALTNAAGTKLLGCFPMNPTKGLADVLDALPVSAQVAIGGPNFGELTVAN